MKAMTLYDYRIDKKFGGSVPLVWNNTVVVESIPLSNDPLIYLTDLINEIQLPEIKLPKFSVAVSPFSWPEVSLAGIFIPRVDIASGVDWFTGVVEEDLFSLLDKVQIASKKVMDFLTAWNYRLGGYYYVFESTYLRKEQVATYLRKLSIICLAFSLAGFLMVSTPMITSEIKYGIIPYLQHESNLATEQKITENIISPQVPPPALPKDINEFSISVPKINLTAKVIPEVDPNNEKEYSEKLKQGVAQAKGSYLPGQGGPVFLFSHSTDSILDISKYDALFFGIKDLKTGDKIDIHFEGKDYKYTMTDRKVVSPDDLTSIQNSKSDLVLSTCFPPGTNWQRLLIFAKQV